MSLHKHCLICRGNIDKPPKKDEKWFDPRNYEHSICDDCVVDKGWYYIIENYNKVIKGE